MPVRLSILGITLLLYLMFLLSNTQSVSAGFLFWRGEISLAAVIGFSSIVGGALLLFFLLLYKGVHKLEVRNKTISREKKKGSST